MMKILWVMVLVLVFFTFGNSQSVARKTTLKGTIFNQVGGRIADVWVSVKDVEGKSHTFQSSTNGTYSTQVLPGTYSIDFRFKNGSLYESYKIKNYEVALTTEVVFDITLRTSKEFRNKFGDLVNKNQFINLKSN